VAEVVPLSATVCVVGGGFHPVVVFGSIWRGSAVPLPRPETITLATGHARAEPS
jgi:hypothetical protein